MTESRETVVLEETGKLFQKLSVLVVHADDNMVRLLGSILTGLGVRKVFTAGDGPRALSLLEHHKVDLVMTGYRMRPMDGLQLARKIRDPEGTHPYVPIIMVTGEARPDVVIQAREAGVHEFLVTPVSVKAVSERIAIAVGRPRPFVKASDYFGPDRRRRSGIPVPQERRRNGGSSTGAGGAEAGGPEG